MLAKIVFEEAVRQHNFLPMYADLCVRLIEHFGEESGWMLRDYLLEQCWMSFQAPVTECLGCTEEEAFQQQQQQSQQTADACPEGYDICYFADPAAGCIGSGGVEGVEDDAWPQQEDYAGQQEDGRNKKNMLGSVRFMGELFNRSLLPPYGIITCAWDLLQYPLTSDSVELAVAFLKVVGPVFDCPEWPHFSDFRNIFWDLRGMTFDQSIAPRVRFLLRDLLELRDHSWLDTRYATREARPKRLEDVRWEAAAEAKPVEAETPTLNPAFQFCPLRTNNVHNNGDYALDVDGDNCALLVDGPYPDYLT